MHRIAPGGSPVTEFGNADGTLLNGNFATLKTVSPLASGPRGAWGTDLYAVAANGDLVRVDLQGKCHEPRWLGF